MIKSFIRKIDMKIGILVFMLILELLICVNAYATEYYVDATNGNDTDSGNSPNSAWQTISRVNNGIFNPGRYNQF